MNLFERVSRASKNEALSAIDKGTPGIKKKIRDNRSEIIRYLKDRKYYFDQRGDQVTLRRGESPTKPPYVTAPTFEDVVLKFLRSPELRSSKQFRREFANMPPKSPEGGFER